MNPDSIHADRGLDLKGARDALVERLLDGLPVNGLRIENLIDSDIDQGRLSSKDAAMMICAAGAQGRTEDQAVEALAKIERTLRLVAERHIDSKPDLIQEQAEQFALEEQA